MGASLAEVIRACLIVRGMERQNLAAGVGCSATTVRTPGERKYTRYAPETGLPRVVRHPAGLPPLSVWLVKVATKHSSYLN